MCGIFSKNRTFSDNERIKPLIKHTRLQRGFALAVNGPFFK